VTDVAAAATDVDAALQCSAADSATTITTAATVIVAVTAVTFGTAFAPPVLPLQNICTMRQHCCY